MQVAGTLILFSYLVMMTPLMDAIGQLRGIHLGFALLSVILVWVGLTINVYVWAIILRGLRFSVSFPRVWSLFFQSWFVNNLVPSFVGGDLVRSYRLGRATQRTLDVGISVLVSRVAMVCTLLVLGGTTMYLWGPRAGWGEGMRWVGAVLAGAAALLFGVYPQILRCVTTLLAQRRSHWMPNVVRDTIQSLLLISTQRGIIAVAFFGSLLSQVISIWAVWWLAVALQVPVTWWQILLILSVLRIALILPISLNGFGLREVGYVSLLTGMGIDTSQALALALAASLLALVSSFPGGLLLLKESCRPGPGKQLDNHWADV